MRIVTALSILGLASCKPAATTKSDSIAARSPEAHSLLADNPWADRTPEEFLKGQKFTKVESLLELSAQDVRLYMAKAEAFRDDEGEGEDDGGFGRCSIQEAKKKGKAEAQGNTFHLHVETDLRHCSPSKPGQTITKLMRTMDFLIICEHGDLSKFNGTDGLEAGPDDCDNGKFLKYSRTQLDFSAKDGNAAVDKREISYTADAATGLPCVATREASGKMSSENCADITTTYYEVDKVDGKASKREGKTDLEILGRRLQGTVVDVTLGNWQGEIQLTSKQEGRYTMRSDRDEEIKGALGEALQDAGVDEEAGLRLTRKPLSGRAKAARADQGRVSDQVRSMALRMMLEQ